MFSLLQTLVDNGLSRKTLATILQEIIGANLCGDSYDQRSYIAYAWALDHDGAPAPHCCKLSLTSNAVRVNGRHYVVLTDDESTSLCRGAIVESLCSMKSHFLSELTGIDLTVFASISDSCSDGSLSTGAANAAILALIKGSCGLDDFANTVIETSVSGRGRFLARKDGVEIEYTTKQGVAWYLYRLN